MNLSPEGAKDQGDGTEAFQSQRLGAKVKLSKYIKNMQKAGQQERFYYCDSNKCFHSLLRTDTIVYCNVNKKRFRVDSPFTFINYLLRDAALCPQRQTFFFWFVLECNYMPSL